MRVYETMYRTILDKAPANALFIVVLPNQRHNINGAAVEDGIHAALNQTFRSVGEHRGNVEFIEMTSLIESIDEVTEDFRHFNRAVYYRLFQEIGTCYQRWLSGGSASAPMERPEFIGARLKPKAMTGRLRETVRVYRRALGI